MYKVFFYKLLSRVGKREKEAGSEFKYLFLSHIMLEVVQPEQRFLSKNYLLFRFRAKKIPLNFLERIYFPVLYCCTICVTSTKV